MRATLAPLLQRAYYASQSRKLSGTDARIFHAAASAALLDWRQLPASNLASSLFWRPPASCSSLSTSSSGEPTWQHGSEPLHSKLTKLPRSLSRALKRNNMERARQILSQAFEHPEPLTLQICNYMLDGCAIACKAQVAVEVLRLMEARGVAPDATSHKCVLRAFCRSGFVEEAVRRLEELASSSRSSSSSSDGNSGGGEEGAKGPVGVVACNIVLNGCARAQRPDLAQRCLAVMQERGLALQEASYMELVKLAGLVQNAAALRAWWAELQKSSGTAVTLQARCTYVVALARAGELQAAAQALGEVCEGIDDGTVLIAPGRYSRREERQQQQQAGGQANAGGQWAAANGTTADAAAAAANRSAAAAPAAAAAGARSTGANAYACADAEARAGAEAGTGAGAGTGADVEAGAGAGAWARPAGADGGAADADGTAEGARADAEGWGGGGGGGGGLGGGRVERRGSRSEWEEWCIDRELTLAFNSVLSAAARSADLDLASSLFSQMLARGLDPDIYTYNALLRAAGATGQIDHALRVWRSMEAGGVPPDGHSYTAMLQAFARAGQLEEAESVLQDMQDRLDPQKPPRHAYNILLEACATQGDHDRALRVLAQMQAERVAPDTCTFLALLRVCGGARSAGLQAQEAQQEEVHARVAAVERSMSQAGVFHTAGTFAALIRVLGSEGMVESVLQRLRSAEGRKGADGKPLVDTVSYNIALQACASAQEMEVGRQLFEDMRGRGPTPDIVTYNTLIHGYAVAGDVGTAFALADALRLQGLAPDTFTYNSLVKAVSHGGELEVALELLADMGASGVPPDDVTYNTLSTVAADSGRLDILEHLVEHMHRQGLPPSTHICSCLVAAYVKVELLDEAAEALGVLGRRMAAMAIRATRPEPELNSSRAADALPDASRSAHPEADSFAPSESHEALGASVGPGDEGVGAAGVGETESTAEQIEGLLSGALEGNPEAVGEYLEKLSAAVGEREEGWAPESSPWAQRVRTEYDRRREPVRQAASA